MPKPITNFSCSKKLIKSVIYKSYETLYNIYKSDNVLSLWFQTTTCMGFAEIVYSKFAYKLKLY